MLCLLFLVVWPSGVKGKPSIGNLYPFGCCMFFSLFQTTLIVLSNSHLDSICLEFYCQKQGERTRNICYFWLYSIGMVAICYIYIPSNWTRWELFSSSCSITTGSDSMRMNQICQNFWILLFLFDHNDSCLLPAVTRRNNFSTAAGILYCNLWCAHLAGPKNAASQMSYSATALAHLP